MTIQVNNIFPGELYPSATVGGCIDIFENAWPNSKETIAAIEAECSTQDSGVKWARAKTIGRGTNQNVRTNYNMNVTEFAMELNNQVAQKIHNDMYLLLLATTIPYAIKHDIDSLYHEGYDLLRYQTGQEYKPHADGTTESGRAVSAIIYLNNDYEGGHVEFTNFGVKIKPEPGMLLLFPSNFAYRHVAYPVTSGTKYALVTWLHDRPL